MVPILLLAVVAPFAHAKDEKKPGYSTAMTCSPAKLSRNDTLTLTFSMPHPIELSVIRPDRSAFFIAQRAIENHRGDGIPAPLFAGITRLGIVPGVFRAKEFRVNAPESELVFDRPGKYRINLADVLGTDDGSQLTSCEVTIVD